MDSRRLRALLVLSLLACTLGAPPARADTGAGWSVGAALASVAYAPVKLAYAAAGAVFGGIAWGLSGGDDGVMRAVVTPAVRGDYLVTPAHLRRERRLVFVGGAPERPVHARRDDWRDPDPAYDDGVDYGDVVDYDDDAEYGY